MNIKLAFRLARIAFHVTEGLLTTTFVFPWSGEASRNRHIKRWSRGLLGICGVQVEVPNLEPSLARTTVVANHVSWLDIFVINAVHPCRFVAKAEIRAWPILGWLADKAGTVFIARGNRRDLRHIFKGLVARLENGERVAFFPEGTTTSQGALLPFHANLFEAAIDASASVQPCALRYVDGDGALHPSVEFIGEMTFAESMLGILAGPPIRAQLAWLAPIDAAGAHRRELAEATHRAVAAALNVDTGTASASSRTAVPAASR